MEFARLSRSCKCLNFFSASFSFESLYFAKKKKPRCNASLLLEIIIMGHSTCQRRCKIMIDYDQRSLQSRVLRGWWTSEQGSDSGSWTMGLDVVWKRSFTVFWLSLKQLIGGHEKCVWNGAQSTSDRLLLEDNDRWDERGGPASGGLCSAGRIWGTFDILLWMKGCVSLFCFPEWYNWVQRQRRGDTSAEPQITSFAELCCVPGDVVVLGGGLQKKATIGPMKHITRIHFAFATCFKTFLSLISLRHCGAPHMLIIDLSINCPHPRS